MEKNRVLSQSLNRVFNHSPDLFDAPGASEKQFALRHAVYPELLQMKYKSSYPVFMSFPAQLRLLRFLSFQLRSFFFFFLHLRFHLQPLYFLQLFRRRTCTR